ncbi:MAG: nucleotide pyrophosphohydrolase [Gemmatimonadetes bacterium]|nr:nucleotide pyrophosphohydrolase [Gemmatimonadota bacterium]MBK9978491.1 nucleotide pyrophosphohydrolase [Gemmatimonadota bacterium]
MTTDRLEQIRDRLRQFTEERDWAQFHTPKNLAMAVVSESGELAAELRWVEGARSDEFVRTSPGQERVAQEVADVAISLLLFCNGAEIDLLEAVEQKIESNAVRHPVELARGNSLRPRVNETGDPT